MPGPDAFLPDDFPPDDETFKETIARQNEALRSGPTDPYLRTSDGRLPPHEAILNEPEFPLQSYKGVVDPMVLKQLADLGGRPSTGAFGLWQHMPAPPMTTHSGYGHELPEPGKREMLEHHVGQILDHLGYDRINGQHFKDTPKRVAEVLLHYAKNGDEALVSEILGVQFTEPEAISSLVLEGPVRYTSRCAHHLEPVDGWAWVGYLPDQNVCGLSKMARVVSFFAAQLTVQELVTQQIADALLTHLKPKGVMVVIRAEHGCMRRRGVMEPCALTTTSAVRGVFKDSPNARNEFLLLMQEPKA